MTDRQTDGQTDRQTSAPFHDMAIRSGPHKNQGVLEVGSLGGEIS